MPLLGTIAHPSHYQTCAPVNITINSTINRFAFKRCSFSEGIHFSATKPETSSVEKVGGIEGCNFPTDAVNFQQNSHTELEIASRFHVLKVSMCPQISAKLGMGVTQISAFLDKNFEPRNFLKIFGWRKM